jgi:hypothetical protein
MVAEIVLPPHSPTLVTAQSLPYTTPPIVPPGALLPSPMDVVYSSDPLPRRSCRVSRVSQYDFD